MASGLASSMSFCRSTGAGRTFERFRSRTTARSAADGMPASSKNAGWSRTSALENAWTSRDAAAFFFCGPPQSARNGSAAPPSMSEGLRRAPLR